MSLCFILGNSHPCLFKDFFYPILFSLSGTLIKGGLDPLTLISSLYSSFKIQSFVSVHCCIASDLSSASLIVSSAVYSLILRFFIIFFHFNPFFFPSSFIWLTPFQIFHVALYILLVPGDILKFVIYFSRMSTLVSSFICDALSICWFSLIAWVFWFFVLFCFVFVLSCFWLCASSCLGKMICGISQDMEWKLIK